jgi:hypothetical protein
MFHHADDHRVIFEAIQNQLGVKMTDYILEPFSEVDLQAWLIRHQTMHNAMNGYLLLQGQDLNQIDFNDEKSRKEWVAQNFSEHFAARSSLNI